MGRRDDCLAQIAATLASDAADGEIEAWLVSNSNLPGPRGNLELAWAFGDAFVGTDVADARWREVLPWLDISEQEAPTGDPREFLAFCALQAAGAFFAQADAEIRRAIVGALRAAASDGRWRIREAVAMGFQRIAEEDFPVVAATLENWVGEASLVEKRAIVATLAHPDLLADSSRVTHCLALVDRILGDLLPLDKAARRCEGFRVLKKGLKYGISVFVAAAPSEGFTFLERWATVGDADIRAILKANLKKARLVKRYPDQVTQVQEMLEEPGP